MTQEKRTTSKLSMNIRKMKFMQRSLTEQERRELEESEKIITNEHWELDIPSLGVKNTKFEVAQSFLICESYRFGHLSFGGFNKYIERLMRELNSDETDEYHESADISDNEMAEHYLSLGGTIAKRFDTGKKRSINDKESPEVFPKKPRSQFQVDSRGFMKPEP